MQRQSLTASPKQSNVQPITEQWPSLKATLPVPFFPHNHGFTAEHDIVLYGMYFSPVWVSYPCCVPSQPFAYF